MIRAALISLALAAAADAAGLDVDRFLDATRAVENLGGRDGALGERGPYQIRAATWAMHMPGIDFALARQEATGRACALKHVTWLREHLVAAGIDDNAFNVALAYNAGLESVRRGRAPVRAYQHAGRVRAIYNAAEFRGDGSHRESGMAPRPARVMSENRHVSRLEGVCLPSTH